MICSNCSTTESKKWCNDQCLKCWKSAYYKKNKTSISARTSITNAARYKRKRTEILDKTSAWSKANKIARKAIVAKWDRNNQPYRNSIEASRRAVRAMATPKWLSKQQKSEIAAIYLNCPVGHHVDHIVPLNGINVRGLHVPWNLQYLLASENLKKSNKVRAV